MVHKPAQDIKVIWIPTAAITKEEKAVLPKCMDDLLHFWIECMKLSEKIQLFLSYTIGNPIEKKAVCEECKRMGIPFETMQWSEEKRDEV